MKFNTIHPDVIATLRKIYPVGCRVKLIHMNDVQAPPMGTLGTVLGVDDSGSLIMRWDNGSGLNVAFGEDIVMKVDDEGKKR